MNPEKEGEGQPGGEENSAVVVDLTATKDEKLVTPATPDEGGDKPGDKGVSQDATDDASDDDADGSAQDDDGEEKPSGRSDFQKRLKREIRQKVTARAENATLSQENQRLAEENEQLRRRRAPREEAPNTSDLDTKIGTAQASLEKAIEDGDSKAQARLHTEIADLTSEKRVRLARPRPEPEERDELPPRRRERAAPGPTPTGRAFVESNSDWWNNPKHSAARSAVVSLDKQLMDEGSDPNSESHYARIAKRAKAMGLKVKIRQPFEDGNDDMDSDDNDDPPPRRERRVPPQGGNGSVRQAGNSEYREAMSGKITLTEKDKETMRTFKLNPDNPQHLRAFAKARQERIQQENGR